MCAPAKAARAFFCARAQARVFIPASSAYQSTRAYVECKQLGHRTTRVQLRSDRHDNAKGTVATPKRVQQAGWRQCTASDTRAQWTAAATDYKQVQQLKAHCRQSTARTSASNSNHDESSALTTPLFLVSEASTRRNARSSAHETNYS